MCELANNFKFTDKIEVHGLSDDPKLNDIYRY